MVPTRPQFGRPNPLALERRVESPDLLRNFPDEPNQSKNQGEAAPPAQPR